MTQKKQSILMQIIEKGIEVIKKPFVIKRVKRAFDSAKDSIDEQIEDTEASINIQREKLVEAAKGESPLKEYIQALIDARVRIEELKLRKEVLEEEMTEFLTEDQIVEEQD